MKKLFLMTLILISSFSFAQSMGQGGGNGKMTILGASAARMEAIKNQIMLKATFEESTQMEFKAIYYDGRQASMDRYVVEITKNEVCFAQAYLVGSIYFKNPPYSKDDLREVGKPFDCK